MLYKVPRLTRRTILKILALVVLLCAIILFIKLNRQAVNETGLPKPRSTVTPKLKTEIIVKGLTNPWDVGFADINTMFFTERPGRVSVLISGRQRLLMKVPDAVVRGEGGLLGLAVDPDFAANHFIYTCFNTKTDIRLTRWKVNNGLDGLAERQDIITGIPINSRGQTGRHSGCRPRWGPDGYLWVGTGDAAVAQNAQDPASLGGKILRVDREGAPAPGNLEAPFDARIFSYGHRNTQGLAFFNEPIKGIHGFSAEHGPDVDDEINPLEKGNFGWAPEPPYNEKVPMTDLAKFPDAISATWKSGDHTIAPSGLTFVRGGQWQAWDGALMIAVLKGKHARVLIFDETDKFKIVDEIEILKDFGRIRSVAQGPDGNLYFSTDNGHGTDQIVRVSPK